VLILLICIPVLLGAWVLLRTYLPPQNPNFERSSFIRVVACVGDSITMGRAGFDYVAALRERNPQVMFLNYGKNSEMAVNVWRRLESTMVKAPNDFVLLIGTNDVNASLTPFNRKFYRLCNRLTEEPSMESFDTYLRKIAARLKEEFPRARLGLSSLPVIGEDLASPQNEKVRQYNKVIHQVCTDFQSRYIPLYERLESLLKSETPKVRRAYSDNLLETGWSLFRRYVFLQSWNTIARSRGQSVLTDFLHLNERGGEVLVDEVEKFLALQKTQPSETA
jgi:hypothetical protein